MDKATAFTIFNTEKANFFSSILYPEGEKITRAALTEVDCVMVNEVCLVFRNKNGKNLVVPFTTNLPRFEDLKSTNEKRREFPTLQEIERDFLEPIIRDLIFINTKYSNEIKNELFDFLPTWIRISPANPQNKQKIEQYESLKKELSEKGLI